MSYSKLIEKQTQLTKKHKTLKKELLKNTLTETMIIIFLVLVLYFLVPILANIYSDIQFLITLKKLFLEQIALILIIPPTIFFLSKIGKIPPQMTENNRNLQLIKDNLKKKQ